MERIRVLRNNEPVLTIRIGRDRKINYHDEKHVDFARRTKNHLEKSEVTTHYNLYPYDSEKENPFTDEDLNVLAKLTEKKKN